MKDLNISSLFSVYQLITRRRFEQMTVLEGQNILVTISGRKRRIRVYYLSWLKQKILRTEGVNILHFLFSILNFTPDNFFNLVRKTEWLGECWRSSRISSFQDCSL